MSNETKALESNGALLADKWRQSHAQFKKTGNGLHLQRCKQLLWAAKARGQLDAMVRCLQAHH